MSPTLMMLLSVLTARSTFVFSTASNFGSPWYATSGAFLFGYAKPVPVIEPSYLSRATAAPPFTYQRTLFQA